jgi:hypothetical protein
MRFLTAFISLAFLGACAATEATTAPAATAAPPASASPVPSRTAQMLLAAGGQNAPTRSEIERALGAPAIARQDGAGAALTYRFENCALLLLFAPDQRNAMRLTEAHASARRADAAAPSLEQCAAETGN